MLGGDEAALGGGRDWAAHMHHREALSTLASGWVFYLHTKEELLWAGSLPLCAVLLADADRRRELHCRPAGQVQCAMHLLDEAFHFMFFSL